jgi:hypothetical protein
LETVGQRELICVGLDTRKQKPRIGSLCRGFRHLLPVGLCWLFLARAARRKVQLGWKIAGDFESGVDARRERFCPCFHDVSSVIGDPPAGQARYSGFNLTVYTWYWPNGFPNYFPSGYVPGGMLGRAGNEIGPADGHLRCVMLLFYMDSETRAA